MRMKVRNSNKMQGEEGSLLLLVFKAEKCYVGLK